MFKLIIKRLLLCLLDLVPILAGVCIVFYGITFFIRHLTIIELLILILSMVFSIFYILNEFKVININKIKKFIKNNIFKKG